MTMIHARGLTRSFRVGKETVEAVRGLDLDVEDGELVAFLGPNGAGKSTSLRMLTTLLRPTSGTAIVAGHDVSADAQRVRERIGYVGQGSGAAGEQRVRDELVVQGRAYGLDKATAGRRADELLEALELGALGKRTANQLSGGQRRRLDVALGLVHAPRLLFLDEPSTGLDPQSRANLWRHLARLREVHGTTIFLTTHYLDEADAMAERVLVIDGGRVIADGTPAELKAGLGGDLVSIGTADGADAVHAAAIIRRTVEAEDVEVDGRTVRLRTAGGDAAIPTLLRALDAGGLVATSADVRHPTLDDVFLELTGRSLRDAGDVTEPIPDADEILTEEAA
jgi:ABC-2 type transport system ATP-binding protein